MRARLLHIVFWLVVSTPFIAKASPAIQDSVLKFEEFMQLVRSNHPLSMQAKLVKQQGEAYLLSARGNFDPAIMARLKEKYFGDSQYYSLADAGLQIPTWFGMKLEGGFEQNEGIYLNPEHNTTDLGLWYAGISVPIGEGLFFDKRRAALRNAQAYLELTEAQRLVMLNDLMFEAGQAYWKWYQSWNELKVYEEAVTVASQRLTGVKESAGVGDRAFIDTVEASIQVQRRQISLMEARLKFRNSRRLIGVFLWDQGYVPLELSDSMVPATNLRENAQLNRAIVAGLDTSLVTHPKMLSTKSKIKQLEVERRWKAEQLKPTLNLKYNALANNYRDLPGSWNARNYSWGVNFAMPVFLRSERGDLRVAKFKLREAELGMQLQQQQLGYKAEAAFNTVQTVSDQLQLSRRTVRDYQTLLTGEQQLFQIGESSLFMINMRELGYIDARVKLVQLEAKSQIAELAFQHAMGSLAYN